METEITNLCCFNTLSFFVTQQEKTNIGSRDWKGAPGALKALFPDLGDGHKSIFLVSENSSYFALRMGELSSMYKILDTNISTIIQSVYKIMI